MTPGMRGMKRYLGLGLAALIALGSGGPAWSGNVELCRHHQFDSGARLKNAIAVAVDETDRRLYVSGYNSHNILLYDLDARGVVHQTTGIHYPHIVRFHPVSQKVVALGFDENWNGLLVVYDKHLRELHRVVLGYYPYSALLSEDGRTAYVGVYNQIVAVNLEDGVSSTFVSLGSVPYSYPFAMAMDPSRGRLLAVGTGWVNNGQEWVLRSAVIPIGMADRQLGPELVLGDRLYSYDAALDRDELFIANI
ncbi:MAG TPA: hypothetical protein P5079_11695, partial [Elusimicrobiota bacterium]|nr:hypothetical protein [Elusimicrobiota bacterium]